MSYSGGASNKNILDFISYYNQLHDFKTKVKRRFKKPPSSSNTTLATTNKNSPTLTTPPPLTTSTRSRDDVNSTSSWSTDGSPKSPATRSRRQPVRDRSIKRRFRKYATSNGVLNSKSTNDISLTNNNNYNSINDGSSAGDDIGIRTRRCKSMIELGDGSITNITLINRGGGAGVGQGGEGKQRKGVRRSVSMKERILDTAGNKKYIFVMVLICCFQ